MISIELALPYWIKMLSCNNIFSSILNSFFCKDHKFMPHGKIPALYRVFLHYQVFQNLYYAADWLIRICLRQRTTIVFDLTE